MTKTIITTVGTSIFENYRQTFLNNNVSIDNAYDNLKNQKAENLDLGNIDIVTLIGDEEDSGALHKFFKGNVVKENKQWKEINDQNTLNTQASAEISSIVKIYEKENCMLKVRLLASDTVLSVLAAKLIKEWFEVAKQSDDKYGKIEILFNDNVKSPNSDYIPKLRTDLNENDIYDGFNNLIQKIIDISKENNGSTIINITSGYRGFIPILTIIAQLESIKLNYIYEDSDELIEIGQFPINFDYDIAYSLADILISKSYKDLDKNSNLFKDFKDKYKLLTIKDNEIVKTSFADILINYVEKTVINKKGFFGKAFEFVLYYYFNENLDDKYKNPSKPQKKYYDKTNNIFVDVQKGNNTLDIGDIDIQLKNKNNDIVIAEVKSFGNFPKGDIDKYIEKIKYRVKSVGAKEFLFIIYTIELKGKSEIIVPNDIIKALTTYKIEITTKLNIDFNAKLVKIDLSKKQTIIDYNDVFDNPNDLKFESINIE